MTHTVTDSFFHTTIPLMDTKEWRNIFMPSFFNIRVNAHRLGLEPDLAARGLQLCRRFALRTATKSRHQDLFHKQENPHITRGGGKVWREPRCRTRRRLMSARPHLTRLLNGESSWYNDSVCLDLLGLVYPGSLMGPYNPHVIWDWAVPHQTIINPTLLLL